MSKFLILVAANDEGWRIGWITVHDADGAFADAGVPETLLKLCQAGAMGSGRDVTETR